MKSIFKKIAFVLALAMVVTMLSARSAAAAAEGPQLKAHRVLYLNEGGDVTGTYLNKAYATVWNFKEDGYTVKFESKNPEIATVGAKKGMVTAVSVGVTEVIATFSKEGAADVVKTCKVEVKKNAAVVTVDEDSQKALTELAVDDKVTMVAVKTDADGSNEDITDGVRFAVADEKVATVNAKTGEITAVAVGETELTVWGVQWEYSMTEKKYVLTKTTPETPYKLVVKEGTINEVKQTAYNQIRVTTTDEDTAKAIAENKDIAVKYYYNDGAAAIDALIQSVTAEGIDVVVTFYNALVEELKHEVVYKDTTLEFASAKLDYDHIRILTTQAEATDEGKETFIKVGIYNADDILAFETSEGNTGKVTLTLVEESEDGSYYLYSDSHKIVFFAENKTANVKAVYDTGFNDDGTKKPDLEHISPIVSYKPSAAQMVGNVEGWAVDASNADKEKLTYKSAVTIAVGDENSYLFGKYTVRNNGKDETQYIETSNSSTFKFSSSNSNVLLVNETSNQLLPVAKGQASVIVRNGNDQVIGVVTVTVVESRTVAEFNLKIKDGKNKLAVTAANDDSVVLELEVKDQLGQNLALSTADIEYKVTNTVNETAAALSFGVSADGKAITLTSNSTSTEAVTAYVQVTVKNHGAAMARTAVVSVKNTVDATATSYRVVPTKSSIDQKLIGKESFVAGDFTSNLNVSSFDKDGFLVASNVPVNGMLTAAPNANTSAEGMYVVVLHNNDDYKNFVGVSGSAITAITTTTSGSAISAKKAPTGNYIVRLYEVTSTKAARILHSATVEVKDTTAGLTFETSGKVATADKAGVAATGVLTFKRDNNPVSVNVVEVGYTNASANSIYVTWVDVEENIAGVIVTTRVAINRLFTK